MVFHLNKAMKRLGGIDVEIFTIDLEFTDGSQRVTVHRHGCRNDNVLRYPVQCQIAADPNVEFTLNERSFYVGALERDLGVLGCLEYKLVHLFVDYLLLLRRKYRIGFFERCSPNRHLQGSGINSTQIQFRSAIKVANRDSMTMALEPGEAGTIGMNNKFTLGRVEAKPHGRK